MSDTNYYLTLEIQDAVEKLDQDTKSVVSWVGLVNPNTNSFEVEATDGTEYTVTVVKREK